MQKSVSGKEYISRIVNKSQRFCCIQHNKASWLLLFLTSNHFPFRHLQCLTPICHLVSMLGGQGLKYHADEFYHDHYMQLMSPGSCSRVYERGYSCTIWLTVGFCSPCPCCLLFHRELCYMAIESVRAPHRIENEWGADLCGKVSQKWK